MPGVRELGLDELIARARGGDRRALGRLITLVERDRLSLGVDASALAHVVGVTGPPGAGKSTLVGLLAARWADRGERVAILAIDPSSPLTGGAILGDRIRMDDRADIFIRSMATRGHAGGLALAVPAVLRVLHAAGFTKVIVETVGVGQAEVEIASTADTTVVVVVPGLGDAIQANKAGLLELADVFVVNKRDRPGASDVRRDLELMLDLAPGAHDRKWRPPIVMTSATRDEGIADVAVAVDDHLAALSAGEELTERRRRRVRREIEEHVFELLSRRAAAAIDAHPELVAEVEAGRLTPADAATRLT